MKNVNEFDKFKDIKNYYQTEPLNEKIDLSTIFRGKSSDERRQTVLYIIKEHSGKRKIYEQLKKEDPIKLEKYIQFVMEKPYSRYFKWDESKFEFTDNIKK